MLPLYFFNFKRNKNSDIKTDDSHLSFKEIFCLCRAKRQSMRLQGFKQSNSFQPEEKIKDTNFEDSFRKQIFIEF